MKRWWMGLALTAVWLGQVGTSQAQYLPEPGCAAPPEPVPFSLGEPAVPGPLDARNTPPVPMDQNVLPAWLPGAFDDRKPTPDTGFYFHFGAVALQRQRPGSSPVALFGPGNIDTTIVPRNSRGLAVAQNFNELRPDSTWGPKATLGVVFPHAVVELTGFYLGENQTNVDTQSPGGLLAFFTNEPIGFEGNNGLWRNADRISTTLEQTLLASGEVNVRHWSTALTGAELLVGARYVNVQERIGIFTDDEGLSVLDIDGFPDPRRQANYTAMTRNQIIAPQLGFEYQYACKHWLSFGCSGKGAWGVNFEKTTTQLTRGDGLLGRFGTRSDTRFAQVYDVGGFIDVYFLERGRFRFGYTGLWVVGVAEAIDQIDYNLLNTRGAGKTAGSIFYHGPSVELQFRF